MPPRATFPRRLRIVRRADFERVLQDGRRGQDGRVTVWVLPNGRPHPRLGLVVGRRVGGAVARNRAKRVLRTAFRLLQHDLPAGFDVVVAPRPDARLTVEDVGRSLRHLVERIRARSARE